MNKVKEFLKTYQAQILIVLGALISFITSMEAFGGQAAIACTIIVAFLELVVYFMKNGLTETFLNMSVKLVQLIVEVVNGEYTVETTTTEEVVSTSGNKSKKKKVVKSSALTEEMIRERLTSK